MGSHDHVKIGRRHIDLRFLFLKKVVFYSLIPILQGVWPMWTWAYTFSNFILRWGAIRSWRWAIFSQWIITEIEVLFFDEEQLHYGDEPYTYTNLTKPIHSFGQPMHSFSQYALGQCVQRHKKPLVDYWPRQNWWIRISDECVSDVKIF